MSTKTAKLIACLIVAAAIVICWCYDMQSNTASAIDLATVLNGRPDLLQQYVIETASTARKDKKKHKDNDDDDDDDDGVPPPPTEPPAGSSGTLGVKVTSFLSGNGGQDCFPTSQGWDRYYSTGLFLGPFVSPLPNPNPFPNTGNVASVTIDTLHSSNGTALATGIVINRDLAPQDKKCATNVGSIIYPPNPNLSKLTFAPTQTNKKYRVTIFYKSSTAGGLTNVFSNWAYP